MSGLRELLDASTPGPWSVARKVDGWPIWVLKGVDGTKREDAELAALSPSLARLAIDMADALRDATSYECWCAHTIGDVCVHCKRRALLARFDRLTTGDAQ